jgi:predicted DNA-binding protein
MQNKVDQKLSSTIINGMKSNNTTEATVKAAKTPVLTCLVTGKTRNTNEDYLQNKATKANATVEEIVRNYVTREVLKNLRKGDLQGLSQEQANTILRLNGKQKGASKARAGRELQTA